MRLQLGCFFQRRAWRILPPFYVALLAFSLMRMLEGPLMAVLGRQGGDLEGVTAGQILAHLFMVHNLSPAWMGRINGSFWSLALEWQLYLVFPLLVWSIRRWGLLPTLGAVLILTVSYRTWVFATKDTTRLDVAYFYCYALPGRLFEFALGMTAAVLLAGQARAAPVLLECRVWSGRARIGRGGLEHHGPLVPLRAGIGRHLGPGVLLPGDVGRRAREQRWKLAGVAAAGGAWHHLLQRLSHP